MEYIKQEKLRVSFAGGPETGAAKLEYYDRRTQKDDFILGPDTVKEIWVDKGSTIRFVKLNWPEDNRHAWRPPPSEPVIRTESGQGSLHWTFFEQYYLDVRLIGADDYGYSASRRASQFGCCGDTWVQGIYSGADWYDVGTQVEFSEWTSGPSQPQRKTDDRRLFSAVPSDAYAQSYDIRYYRRQAIDHQILRIPNSYLEASNGGHYIVDKEGALKLSPPYLWAEVPSHLTNYGALIVKKELYAFDHLTNSWNASPAPSAGILNGRYFLTTRAYERSTLIDLATQESVVLPWDWDFLPIAFQNKYLVGSDGRFWVIDPARFSSLSEWLVHMPSPERLPLVCRDAVTIKGDYLACRATIAPNGACCFQGAPCLFVSDEACKSFGGQWQGEGVYCDGDCPNDPPPYSGYTQSVYVALMKMLASSDGNITAKLEWQNATQLFYPDSFVLCGADENIRTYRYVPSITPNGHAVYWCGPRGEGFPDELCQVVPDQEGEWNSGIVESSNWPLLAKLTAFPLVGDFKNDPPGDSTVGLAILRFNSWEFDECWDRYESNQYGSVRWKDLSGKEWFGVGSVTGNPQPWRSAMMSGFKPKLLSSDSPAIAYQQDELTTTPPWSGGNPQFNNGIRTRAVWFVDRFGEKAIAGGSAWYFDTHDHGHLDSLVMAGDWLAGVDFSGIWVAIPYPAPSLDMLGIGRGKAGIQKRGAARLGLSAELEPLLNQDLRWIDKSMVVIKAAESGQSENSGCIILRAEVINPRDGGPMSFHWSTPSYGDTGAEFEVCPSETTVVELIARWASGDQLIAFAVVRFEPQSYEIFLTGKDLRNPVRLGMTQSARPELIEVQNLTVSSPDWANEGIQYISGDIAAGVLTPGQWDITAMNPVKNLSDTLEAVIDVPAPVFLDRPQLRGPRNGARQVPLKMNLEWAPLEYALTYEIWAGLTPEKLSLIGQTQLPSFGLKLRPLTTVYWKIVAHGAHSTIESSVWSFETVPPPPEGVVGMLPSEGEENVSRPVTLAWDQAAWANSYRVHLGTTDPPPYHTTITDTSLLFESVAADTTYYWRVDSVSGHHVSTGSTNRFRTGIDPLPPSTASITLTPGGSEAPTEVAFEVQVAGKTVVASVWRFGDTKDAAVEGDQVVHRYLFPCSYLVRAWVTTDDGQEFFATATVDIAGDNLSDFNLDGVTNLRDFAHLQNSFSRCAGDFGDFTGEGCLTLLDFESFVVGWTISCHVP